MSVPLPLRFAVLKRDRFTCVYCGAHPPNVELEIDHFWPASKGGADELDNLVTACFDCNRGKRDSVIEDDWPEPGSPLWKWINKGAEGAAEYYKEKFLDRDDKTLADVVELLWPEVDY